MCLLRRASGVWVSQDFEPEAEPLCDIVTVGKKCVPVSKQLASKQKGTHILAMGLGRPRYQPPNFKGCKMGKIQRKQVPVPSPPELPCPKGGVAAREGINIACGALTMLSVLDVYVNNFI